MKQSKDFVLITEVKMYDFKTLYILNLKEQEKRAQFKREHFLMHN